MNFVIKNVFFSILLISKLSVASQQERLSSFYDARTNTEWASGRQHFSNLVVNAATKNYIFCGEFSSDSDIDIQAKNLIILGTLLSTHNIRLKTSHDFFNAGHIEALSDINITSDENIYIGLNDEAITKIQALGINISFNDAEHTSYKIVKPSLN